MCNSEILLGASDTGGNCADTGGSNSANTGGGGGNSASTVNNRLSVRSKRLAKILAAKLVTEDAKSKISEGQKGRISSLSDRKDWALERERLSE